jgi:hypothetical protein
MRDLISRIISAFGSSWGTIGWMLFLGMLIIPYFVYHHPVGPGAIGLLAILTMAWWIMDVVDQDVRWWVILTGIIMILISLLPRGGILTIACWVIYWTRVRE